PRGSSPKSEADRPAARRPAAPAGCLAPRPSTGTFLRAMTHIERVGIVGAGTMGRRIAFACATNRMEARLYDVRPRAAGEAVEPTRSMIENRARDGRLPKEALTWAPGLLRASDTLAACVAGVDLVIETVSENIELKRTVFAEIDRHASPEALIGTNTSSIPG